MDKKRGGEEEQVVNKLILKNAVKHKLKILRQKAYISEREAYDLIRGFFKKYLNVDYEFTVDELKQELKKTYMTSQTQELISVMLEKISQIEHLSKPFSKDDVLSLLSEFENIVDVVISEHYESQSFFTKFKHFFHKSTSNQHKTVLDPNVIARSETNIVRMNILLDEAKRSLKTDLSLAKKKYSDLMELYQTLDEEKQKAYYPLLNEIYLSIKEQSTSLN